MDNVRLFLFFALALVLMFIWQAWDQYQTPKSGTPAAAVAPGATPTVPTAPPPSKDVPSAPRGATQPAQPKPDVQPTDKLPSAQQVTAETDTLRVVIDTLGGDLRGLFLPRYPVSADKPGEPFELMRESGAELFIAQSGLVGHEGSFPTHKVRFSIESTQYRLAAGQSELRIPLTWNAPSGVRYTKTYVLRRGSYLIDVEFRVENRNREPWRGYFYGQFQRTHTPSSGMFQAAPSYTGGAIYSPTEKYEKIPLDDMAKKPLKREVTGGWVAMLQHYFVASWLPGVDARSEFYTDVQGQRHILGFKSLKAVELAPGASGVLAAQLYAGPKEHRILKTLPEGMDLTVDYGWLTLISAPLFWLLDWLHRFIGNWGWAIIALTILIKLAFYPLSAASYKSMANMKKLQPRIQALKERYGDDRQKLNQAMMEMYKTEKINPLGGCLPIVIQIPVFIALYWVLLESVEMRQAPWIFWIRDLSAQDPFYVLPLVMGASMFLQQKLNPQPLDPIQARVFQIMPVFFTVFFLFFPAGLVLYWTVNNLLSIAQQWRINKVIGATSK
ncbi:MAG: hypothetical protein AMJ84_09605 [Acidithiobacillales bacterium SM23_46]|nr:MAG: hypothetical protein AMJ84_09605 [Acidithiobacillales bacterium SM23_46]